MEHSLPHNCDAVAVVCMDFRLWEPNRLATRTFLQQLAEAAGVRNFDLVSLAGGAKNLVDDNRNQSVVLNQIGLSAKLHGIKKVVVTNHFDCGAYGDDGKNRGVLIEDLRRAEAVIKDRFPDLAVIKIFIDLKEVDGQWETNCEAIV